MVGADLSHRAREGGKGHVSGVFGLVGFLLIPMFVLVFFVLADNLSSNFLGSNPWVLVGILAVIFVVLHTALRAAAHRATAMTFKSLKSSVGIAIFVGAFGYAEIFITLFTSFISLLAAPFAAWAGWATYASFREDTVTPAPSSHSD